MAVLLDSRTIIDVAIVIALAAAPRLKALLGARLVDLREDLRRRCSGDLRALHGLAGRGALGPEGEAALTTLAGGPAYDPLLAMATSLARTDPAAARALLGELVRLQPARPEARHEVERLAAQVR